MHLKLKLSIVNRRKKEDFIKFVNSAYVSKEESIFRYGEIFDGEALVFSKHLSSFGIPILIMNIKVDFNGIAKEG